MRSAEVETGTTPLLLSSGALEALDAVIHLKERKMELKKLGVLHITRTRHFAVEVADDSESVWACELVLLL